MNEEASLDQVLSQRLEASKDVVNVDEPLQKLVIFQLCGRHFAFHGERIREILADAEVFFVPGCPGSLDGVINVRGDIESVIRLDRLLNLGEMAMQPSTILLGRSTNGVSSGIRVERVVEVADLPQSLIQPPPSALPEALRPFVTGALEFAGLAVTVLDLDALFVDYVRGLG